ncbi:hypothetical protein [Cellulophaga lytica]|uniref:hypothetical protein n=1 Tax=Cellulophaga lytica TaxID=979 RepID=UPI000B675E3B|nr:hypothetical protein [Cellulophaga lytica]SNQ44780.1 conserved hypothetical protein [Cellulophaga lytica]
MMNLEKENLTHNELIERIFIEYRESDKVKYTSLFLSSFSNNKLSLRSGLAVFSIMQSFPKHSFTINEDSAPNKQLFDKMSDEDKEFVISRMPCKYCASLKQVNYRKDFILGCFLEIGGLIGTDIQNYYCYLSEANKLEVTQPTESDFRIFSEILTILLEADEKDTVKKTVQSKIGKIKGFKSNAEQRQALLETLGYCSILETDEHKGFLEYYTNFASAPKKTHSSDWNYPVDFWLGKDGINKEAFKFWFGEYSQLEKFWK